MKETIEGIKIEEFHKFLMWFRTASHLTRDEFADKIGLTRPQIENIENNRRILRVNEVAAICSNLDFSNVRITFEVDNGDITAAFNAFPVSKEKD